MATTRPRTVEDLERDGVPEGRWELIDGELVEMSPSGDRASTTAIRLASRLVVHVEARNLGRVYGADGGFVLFPDRQLVRVPDVAFVRTDRLPSEANRDGFPRLAPDLAVEVVSPGDSATEVLDKVDMYLKAGVRLVWVIDPRVRSVAIHTPDRLVRLLTAGDELDGGEVLPDFRVAVAELFA